MKTTLNLKYEDKDKGNLKNTDSHKYEENLKYEDILNCENEDGVEHHNVLKYEGNLQRTTQSSITLW